MTRPSRAADTLEPYGVGLSEYELYVGAEGFGRPLAEQAYGAEALVGYGVTPRFTLYLSPSFGVDGYLGESLVGFAVGGYGTPVDTAHLDLDLGAAGGTDGAFGEFSPFAELNLDLEPELGLAGLYARGSLDLFGTEHADGRRAVELGAGGTLGAYATLARRHQLLLELDGAAWDGPGRRVDGEIGAVHLGYNGFLFDHAELITEVSLDVPGPRDDWALGFVLGVIATAPPGP